MPSSGWPTPVYLGTVESLTDCYKEKNRDFICYIQVLNILETDQQIYLQKFLAAETDTDENELCSC